MGINFETAKRLKRNINLYNLNITARSDSFLGEVFSTKQNQNQTQIK